MVAAPYEPTDERTTKALQLAHSEGMLSGIRRGHRANLFFSRTLRLEYPRLDLPQQLANLVGRALPLVKERAEQALEIGAQGDRDGGGRVPIEAHHEFL